MPGTELGAGAADILFSDEMLLRGWWGICTVSRDLGAVRAQLALWTLLNETAAENRSQTLAELLLPPPVTCLECPFFPADLQDPVKDQLLQEALPGFDSRADPLVLCSASPVTACF